jgi:Protein of unknown function (DUF3108)
MRPRANYNSNRRTSAGRRGRIDHSGRIIDRKVRRTALRAGVVYAVAACAFTWPLVLHPFRVFGAADPAGDPSLNLWTLAWDLRTISTHPAWLVTGRVFDAPMFFPAHQSLAYSDHLLLQAAALWPAYALTHDPVFCYNVLLIASLAAAALSMYLLARTLTGDERAAFVAGLIFGFAPYHFTHLIHIQLQALYFLPLSFLFLHRVFAAGRRSDVVLLGVVLGLQVVSSVYYGVIGAIGIACGAIALAAATRRLGDLRLLGRGLAAVAIAAAVALPWSLPYLRVERDAAAGRNLFEASHGSAVLASYVQAPGTNALYGRTGWLQPAPDARLPRKEGPEQALFVGFVPLLLAAVGAAAAPRHLKRIAAVYAAVVVAGVVLSLGPDGVRPVYAALYRSFFGMSVIRAAARFSVLALCGVAVLAAIGVTSLVVSLSNHERARSSTGSGRAILLLASAAIAIEYANGAIAYPLAPALTSNAGRWLRDQPGTGAVVCVPMGFETANTRCMLQAIEHGRPIANGYSGLRPPFFPTLVDAMSELPSRDALQTLHDIGVDFIVSDRALTPDASLEDTLVERARFDDQRVYQVAWSPEIDALISDSETTAPPEPGEPPFALGESATYQLRWLGGPMNLPAGDATVSVAAPERGEAFRFVVSGASAGWVSSFYETRAQLETATTARLLPLRHHATIAEGRRSTERDLAFDHEGREVRMTTGGAAVTLPLARGARDPISALFYVRTLPLRPGAHIVAPLTDNGRRSQLDVSVAGIETITVAGRTWQAWKLTPRIGGRVERQAPLAMTTWLSADERRIPLVFEVTGPFGTVRGELKEYRER